MGDTFAKLMQKVEKLHRCSGILHIFSLVMSSSASGGRKSLFISEYQGHKKVIQPPRPKDFFFVMDLYYEKHIFIFWYLSGASGGRDFDFTLRITRESP